jgi:hypothetical protein
VVLCRTQPVPFPSNDEITDHITNPAACSSLKAVAWGLAYYDLYRLLFTVRLQIPKILTPDTAPDRTWALTAAFNRNLHDKALRDRPQQSKGPTHHQRRRRHDARQQCRHAPQRQTPLLRLQHYRSRNRWPIPSFQLLGTLRSQTSHRLHPRRIFPPGLRPRQPYLQPKHFADISLATAARLSATFPYVSSGTRIPSEYTQHAYHFLDGGYYDNDGTASVIEFLKSALGTPPRAAKDVAQKLKILLIEIRDDDGASVVTNQDDLAGQNGSVQSQPPKPWTTLNQLDGPLLGLWNAGHESISRRNRRELCLLETAYEGSLAIHHVVFTIPKEKDKISR